MKTKLDVSSSAFLLLMFMHPSLIDVPLHALVLTYHFITLYSSVDTWFLYFPFFVQMCLSPVFIGGTATESFEDVGHSTDARELMQQYEIGELPQVVFVLVCNDIRAELLIFVHKSVCLLIW